MGHRVTVCFPEVGLGSEGDSDTAMCGGSAPRAGPAP